MRLLRKLMLVLPALTCGFLVPTDNVAAESRPAISPKVQAYLDQRRGEFDQIPAERQQQLQKIAAYVNRQKAAGQPARLTFICTHNSRRSHLSQIWAMVAAMEQGVAGVETFSGGTEATAFNPRAIAAIQRAGLIVEKTTEGKNPHYTVRCDNLGKGVTCFSKVYSDAPNPTKDFCAVMTCLQADESCPLVQGSALRIAIPYEDPKVADDTPEEAARYDERCAQISREMLYLFSRVGK